MFKSFNFFWILYKNLQNYFIYSQIYLLIYLKVLPNFSKVFLTLLKASAKYTENFSKFSQSF